MYIDAYIHMYVNEYVKINVYVCKYIYIGEEHTSGAILPQETPPPPTPVPAYESVMKG
jgi:hypothetical protein